MKFLQLRYLREIVRHGLSISLASEALHTSQSGVSRQIQLLEEELKLQIFQRNGKRLVGITLPGQAIIKIAEQALREMDNITRVGAEYTQKDRGTLTIATTHTQSRYFLPRAVKEFMRVYPHVTLAIHQGNPTQVADEVNNGEADIGITTETINTYQKIVSLPCYEWNRCLIAQEGHPIISDAPLTLEKISAYPLITYNFAYSGSALVKRAFNQAGFEPNIVLTAIDADVIKTYVSLGLGIGLLADMAFDPIQDKALAMLDASHLFPANTTYLGLHRDAYLRDFIYDFIQILVPKLNRTSVSAAMNDKP